MVLVTTVDAQKLRLGQAIVFRYVAASQARSAGVVRRYGQQRAAVPRPLVRQLPPEFAPALIENGTIQTGFLADLLPRLFDSAFGRLGDICSDAQ